MIPRIEQHSFKKLSAYFKPYVLNFKRPGGTSRGVLTEKPTWFLIVWESDRPDIVGIGECSPLRGLSVENIDTYPDKMKEVCDQINEYQNLHLARWPSIKFGLETALLDLIHKGKRIVFPSDFSEGKATQQINGLIWMGEKDFMLQQIEEKLQLGFTCIKMKIGAIDFEAELALLKAIRDRYSAVEVELRVDANGAFNPREALEKLKRLSEYQLHSIEQPIKQGQWDDMAKLCEQTPLPIALDEELIGIYDYDPKALLLDYIKPQYIILKPSLVGGIEGSEHWIEAATSLGIGWWATSLLESNIGLNAIAQWAYTKQNDMPQGLGTGQLYTNNMDSPLYLNGEQLGYDPTKSWDLRIFHQ